jgi:prophage regulatory protein
MHIIRSNELPAIVGVSKTTFYSRVKDGLFPPPLNLGGTSRGYLSTEVEAMLRAYGHGLTGADLKAYVLELIKVRDTAFFNAA